MSPSCTQSLLVLPCEKKQQPIFPQGQVKSKHLKWDSADKIVLNYLNRCKSAEINARFIVGDCGGTRQYWGCVVVDAVGDFVVTGYSNIWTFYNYFRKKVSPTR